MKRFVTGTLCVLLILSLALSGCASREASPVPEEEPASQSEPEEPASEPEEPEPQSSEPDEQEPEYPLPELTDADMKLINQSLSQFLNYFGGTESLSSTSELDPDRVLFFCQMEMCIRDSFKRAYFASIETSWRKGIPLRRLTRKVKREVRTGVR